MAWFRKRHPCQLCGTPTNSAAARRSGDSPFLVSWTVVNSTQVEHVCDACWNTGRELQDLPLGQRHQHALDLAAAWLNQAPLSPLSAERRQDLVAHDVAQELDFPEAQQQFATAAVYRNRDDGAGTVLAWQVAEHRRFSFKPFEVFPPGRYDNVLIRSTNYVWSSTEGSSHTGSVYRTANNTILLTWSYLREFDHS